MAAPTFDVGATQALIGVHALVDALALAVLEHADGRIVCPDRIVLPMSDEAVLLSMPAAASDVAIHKLITVAPNNAARGRPTITGTLTILDPSTGDVRAVLDGPTVTALRTAAISMLAIYRFAHRPVDGILLIGTGEQARHHVAAIAARYPEARVRIRGRSRDAARDFCANARVGPVDLAPATDDDASRIVITCTTSRTPVYSEPARDDRLLIAVGSFQPTIAEIAKATVLASAVCVDDPRGAPHEAGDLLLAGFDWSRVTSLADALRRPGERPVGPHLFKSVGCAAWDLAAARVALAAMA